MTQQNFDNLRTLTPTSTNDSKVCKFANFSAMKYVCLSVDFRSGFEIFFHSIHMVTSLLAIKECKFLSILGIPGHWPVRLLAHLRAQLSFSDHNFSVVRRRRCFRSRKILTFSSSETLDQFQLNLSQNILGCRRFKFVQTNGPLFYTQKEYATQLMV